MQLFATFALAALAAVEVSASLQAFHKATLVDLPSTSKRDLTQRQSCQGTCEECFGSGYMECPDSNYYCYKPGDPTYGLDSCKSGSTTGGSGSGVTCEATYGANYRECPGFSNYPNSCYDSTLSSGTEACYGDGTTTDYCTEGSSCSTCFGSGYQTCQDDSGYCYQPGNATSCCPSTCDAAGAAAGGSASSGSSSAASASTSSRYSVSSTASYSSASSSSLSATQMTSQATMTMFSSSPATSSGTVATGALGGDDSTTSATPSVEQQTGASGAESLAAPLAAIVLPVLGWLIEIF